MKRDIHRAKLLEMPLEELVKLMQSNTPIARARKAFYHNAAKLEQMQEQSKPPNTTELRRQEFLAALEIIEAWEGNT